MLPRNLWGVLRGEGDRTRAAARLANRTASVVRAMLFALLLWVKMLFGTHWCFGTATVMPQASQACWCMLDDAVRPAHTCEAVRWLDLGA